MIVTLSTVGYGDVLAKTPLEYIFSIIVMLVGVIAFSFASGALTSIISNYDNTNGE